MHEEIIAVTVPISHEQQDGENKEDLHTETLIDMLVAPSYVVRAFAEFLADRDEDESFTLKDATVKFADCCVTVGDSKKVVGAYECLKGYNIPLSNYAFFVELIKKSTSTTWKLDPNFRLFEKWFLNR